MASSNDNVSMALFCDFENVALGVRYANYDKFVIKKVLERLLLKGSIVVKKAYCDWDRYKAFKAPMHEASFELIEIPHVRQSGKNSADIRMVVDALDLCYLERFDDAASGLDRAEATLRDARLPPTARSLMARAKLFDSRGNAAGARTRALEALAAAPGRCETLQLLAELSRRDGSASEQQKLAQALLACGDGQRGLAQVARERGELGRAEELLSLGVRLRPGVPQRYEQLSEIQAARKELPQAIA